MWSFCRLFVKQRSHITLLRTSCVHKYSILEKKSSDLNWKPRQVLEWVGKPDNLQSGQVQWQECDRHHWTPGNTSIITTNVYFKANSWTAINDHHSCTHFKPLHHVRANCQWWSRSTTGKTNLISQTIVSLSMDTAPISACQLQGDLHDNYGWHHGDDHEEYDEHQLSTWFLLQNQPNNADHLLRVPRRYEAVQGLANMRCQKPSKENVNDNCTSASKEKANNNKRDNIARDEIRNNRDADSAPWRGWR